MTEKKKKSQFNENVPVYNDWATPTKEFDSLPKPVWRRDEEGEIYRQGWIFRGHKRESYRLVPSIERAYPYCEWAAAEHKILVEFRSKARMHMEPAQIPQTDHKLGWLSVMQHYGAPTRFLDFTYSPHVALYFALRNREKNESKYAEVWGIDATALRRQAARISMEADNSVRERKGEPPRKGGRVSLRAEDMSSALQQAQEEDELWDTLVGNALEPCGTRRAGCYAAMVQTLPGT